MNMFSRILRYICVASALAGIPAADAFATYNPFMPRSCTISAPRNNFEAVVQPVQVTAGNRIYLSTNGPIQNGALIGFIDRNDPAQSQLAVAFPSALAGGWLYDVGGAFWVANARNEAYSLAVVASRDIRNPALPFNRRENLNSNSYNNDVFNDLLFYRARQIGLTAGAPPIGTQVMDANAKRMIAAALANGEAIDFGAMVVLYSQFASAYNWEQTICRNDYPYGYMQHLLHIQPTSFALDVEPINGAVEVTQGTIVHRVPDACVSKGDRMECPIRTRVNTVPGGFTLKLDKVDANQAWLLVDGHKTDSVDISQLGSTTLVATGAYLSGLLGTQDVVSLGTLALTMVPNDMPQLTAPLDLLSNVQLKRLTFGVTIDERDSSALGRYSGSVGQDPEIMIPLTIGQFGASKATKVSVQVVADSIAMPQGPRCKFVGNQGATVVGIPANVRFHSGTELIDRPDNCSGISYDIASMKWREIVGGDFPYKASLDMDLIFPLSPQELNLDVSGNAWVGTVEAKGEVVVKGEWN
ncbi:hypothetical protein [Burkholderia diffusa]|uniref:hypothetical protein n=1 Tax=Burkholderia diffusa TaxID=488732 RepID=UPI000770C725|nr:hypothetical protein [Burkholderia diffusa]KVC48823.1 hypothetical protein WI71_09515 [Burkholderia diffusa]